MYVPEVLHILAFTHFCTGIAGLIGGVIDQFVDIETFLVIGEGIVADMKWGGPLLSFDVSILITMLNILVLRYLWNENYGLKTTKMINGDARLALTNRAVVFCRLMKDCARQNARVHYAKVRRTFTSTSTCSCWVLCRFRSMPRFTFSSLLGQVTSKLLSRRFSWTSCLQS